MALSDCIECWDTPCTCGLYWKDYNIIAMTKQITRMLNFKSKKEARKILDECLIEIKNRKKL